MRRQSVLEFKGGGGTLTARTGEMEESRFVGDWKVLACTRMMFLAISRNWLPAFQNMSGIRDD